MRFLKTVPWRGFLLDSHFCLVSNINILSFLFHIFLSQCRDSQSYEPRSCGYKSKLQKQAKVLQCMLH